MAEEFDPNYYPQPLPSMAASGGAAPAPGLSSMMSGFGNT